MKNDPYGPTGYCGILNQEILRSRALIAQLKANNETAHELFHTLANLLTVRFLLLDAIRQTSRQARRIRLHLRCTRPASSAMRLKHTRRHLTVLRALAILEAATLHCRDTNINTPAISDACGILERRIQPQWLVSQFRCYLGNGQERRLRVTFLEIRAAVAQLVRRKRDSLALKLHYTRNLMIKQEFDFLGRELAKLDRPWELPDG